MSSGLFGGSSTSTGAAGGLFGSAGSLFGGSTHNAPPSIGQSTVVAPLGEAAKNPGNSGTAPVASGASGQSKNDPSTGSSFASLLQRPSAGAQPTRSEVGLFGGGSSTGSSKISGGVPGGSLFGSNVENTLPSQQPAASLATGTASPLFGAPATAAPLDKNTGDTSTKQAPQQSSKPQQATSSNQLQVTSSSSKVPTSSSEETHTDNEKSGSSLAPTSILDACQYDRLDQLLRKWESRVQRQISDFSSIAETVMNLDLDLCEASSRLATMQLNQHQIAKKQQEIDEAVMHTQGQQQQLGEMLQQMEAALTVGKNSSATQSSKDSSGTGQESYAFGSTTSQLLQNRLQSFTTMLDDTEALIQELTDDVNAIQAKLYPGAIGEILDILNIQQLAITRIEDDAQLLRERLKQINQHLH